MPIELTGLSVTDQQKTTQSSEVKVTHAEPTVPQQQTGANNTSDTVTLTDIASKLQKLESGLSVFPIVDTQRVEGIKNLIEQGNFKLDSTRTAEKFIEFERQLLIGASKVNEAK